jgi:hypothetical protein
MHCSIKAFVRVALFRNGKSFDHSILLRACVAKGATKQDYNGCVKLLTRESLIVLKSKKKP